MGSSPIPATDKAPKRAFLCFIQFIYSLQIFLRFVYQEKPIGRLDLLFQKIKLGTECIKNEHFCIFEIHESNYRFNFRNIIGLTIMDKEPEADS